MISSLSFSCVVGQPNPPTAQLIDDNAYISLPISPRPPSPFLLYTFHPVTLEIEVNDVREVLKDLLPPKPPQPASTNFLTLVDATSSSSSSSSLSPYPVSIPSNILHCNTQHLSPQTVSDNATGTLIFDPYSDGGLPSYITMTHAAASSSAFEAPQYQKELLSTRSFEALEVTAFEDGAREDHVLGFERLAEGESASFNFEGLDVDEKAEEDAMLLLGFGVVDLGRR